MATKVILVAGGGAALVATMVGAAGIVGEHLSDVLLLMSAATALLLARSLPREPQ